MKKRNLKNLNRLLAFVLLLTVLLINAPKVLAETDDEAAEPQFQPGVALAEPAQQVPAEPASDENDGATVEPTVPEETEPLPTEEEPSEEEPEEGAEPEEEKEGEATDKTESGDGFVKMSPEEQYDALMKMSDEEIEAALSELSEEQVEALKEYIEKLAPKEEPPKTVVYTRAGPLRAAVKVASSTRKLMAKVPLRGPAKNSPDGLELEKNIRDNGDDTYTITLETYTTGEVISQEISVPVDVVLVLDQSGSMAYDFNGNSTNNYNNTRQKAMIDAVQNFISSVHEKYSESADHRISIVTFGSNANDLAGWTTVDDTGYAALTADVNGLPRSPSGATNVAAGMGRAQHLVTDELNYTGSNTTRQKVVVVFTDGVPTTQTNFSTGVANGAINAGKNIKDAGATIYTVGIFTGANPSELYGASGFSTNSNGSVNSYWQSNQFLIFGDIDAAEVPAGNRFLNYLSSNFRDATEIGLTPRIQNYIIYSTYRFTITRNFTRTTTGYYLTANDASSLDNVFQSIAEQIATPAIDLGSDTVVKDILSPQLQLPEGSSADSVRFYTQAYNGNDSWGAKTQVTDGSIHLTAGENEKTVNVTGFDYNANCVTEEVKEDGTHGKKLIIEITVEPDPNFLGGTIETNGPNSGIYVPGSDAPIGTFEVPTSPFKMKSITPDSAVRNIYMSTEDELADTFSNLTFHIGENAVVFDDLFNGVNNAGVDYELIIKDENDVIKGTYRIPAGKTPLDEGAGWDNGNIPILTEHSYTIDSVVSDKTCPPWDPRLDPDDPAYDPDAPKPQVMEGHIDLNVFKPSLTYTDKNVYYKGAQIDVAAVVPTNVEWKWEETLDTEVVGGMDTTKPSLTYTYSGATGTTVDQTDDYTVTVTGVLKGEGEAQVNLLTTDFAEGITFKRSCTAENLDEDDATAAAAFKIHVYTPTVTFADKNVYYMGAVPAADALQPTEVKWYNGTAEATGNLDNGAAPALTYEFGALPTGTIARTTPDYLISVTVKAGTDDITDAAAFKRTCATVDTDTTDESSADAAFALHIYTPRYEFVDMSKYYGEDITLPAAGDYTPVWKNANDEDAPSVMDNTAPTLTVTLTPADDAIRNGYVWAAEDFDVAAAISAGETDITEDIIADCTRTCDIEEALTPTAAKAFVVHVKTLKVNVKKLITGLFADLTKEYSFSVSFAPNGSGAPTYTADSFTLGNNQDEELENLPLGTLTLTETGVPENYKVTFKVNGTAGSEQTPAADGTVSSTGIVLADAKDENDEVKVEVTNKLESIPTTAVADGMSGMWFVLIAVFGLAFIATVSLGRRLIRHGRR